MADDDRFVDYDPPAGPIPAGVPAPRLQLRWLEAGEERWECRYELVLPLRKHDARNDAGKNHAVIRFSSTIRTSRAAPCTEGNRCDMPFRDGAHARWDAEVFGGMPIYVIGPEGTFARFFARDEVRS